MGLPTADAIAFLQEMVTEHAVHHREVELEIRCELSREVLDDLFAMTSEGVGQYLAGKGVEQPIWAMAGHVRVPGKPPYRSSSDLQAAGTATASPKR